MKYLFAILISVLSIESNSASNQLYNETGALPSTREDWERVGVPKFSTANLWFLPPCHSYWAQDRGQRPQD